MTETLLPTTVVDSYPQPDWLIDREKLTHFAAGSTPTAYDCARPTTAGAPCRAP
jgi:hypothetical protein